MGGAAGPAPVLRCMGAVLAGGASSRMGADKAFIEVGGAPMVVRAAAALRAAGAAPALVVGGARARLDALGLEVVEDRCPGEGPLGGVVSALEALDARGGALDAVVTLPCDLVAPDPAAVRRVMEGLATAADGPPAGSQEADLAVPVGGGVPQWTHAVWRRRCLGPLSEAFERGARAPREAARLLRAVTVDVPGEGWFRDADRPEDLPGHRSRSGV